MAGQQRVSGFGYIQKRPNGKWQGSFLNPRYGVSPDEKRRVVRTFETKTAATSWLSKQKVEIDKDEWLSPIQDKQRWEQRQRQERIENITFGQYAEAWLENKQKTIKPSSMRRYLGSYAHIEPRWKNEPIKEISKQDVNAWIAGGIAGDKAKTSLMAFQLFKQIMRSALDDDVIDRMPFTSTMSRTLTKALENSKKRSKRAVEEWELEQLCHGKDVTGTDGETVHIEGLPEHYVFITRFMAITGLRLGEATALQRGDFDFQNNTFKVERQFTSGQVTTPKTRGSRRVMSMGQEFSEEVKAHLATLPMRGNSGLVFPGQGGEHIRPKAYWESLKRAAKRLGLEPVTAHDLRRTAATNLFQAGVSPKDIETYLGHSTASMSFRYAQTNRTQQQATAAAAYQKATGQGKTSNVTQLPTAANQ